MFRFLTSLLILAPTMVFAKVQRPEQYILMSFDGSKSVPFWKESRQFAAENNIHFTYFASGVYFLSNDKKKNYVEPKLGAGKSAIGFGGATSDIPPRLEQMDTAMNEGHEIGSHGNAHYDGSSYTQAMWNSEFAQFTDLMLNAWKNNGVGKQQPNTWSDYFTNHVYGFRAPQLGVGNGLWASLKDNGYIYDASRVDKMSYWPKKINGLWNFPLVGLTIAGTSKKTLSMDYNFYFGQSKGVEGPSSKFKEYEEQTYNTYIGYFKNNYYGNRAPMHIGHHFSKWNGGAYWNALQRFAKAVCSQPEVKCVTYKELVELIETKSDEIDAYQKGDFDKMLDPKGLSQNLSTRVRELTDEELEQLRLDKDSHFNAHDGEE
jgi:peptidoglycan/xylan/chitin deacetylase (PgdA/CDA1 family)